MSAGDLRSSSLVRGPFFLANSIFRLVLNKDVINNTNMASTKQLELFVQPESLKNPFTREEDLKNNHNSTIKEDLHNRYIIEFLDAHDVENKSKSDTYHLNICC